MALLRENVMTGIVGSGRVRHAVPTVDGKVVGSYDHPYRTLCKVLLSGLFVQREVYRAEYGRIGEAFPKPCARCVREIGKMFPDPPSEGG